MDEYSSKILEDASSDMNGEAASPEAENLFMVSDNTKMISEGDIQ